VIITEAFVVVTVVTLLWPGAINALFGQSYSIQSGWGFFESVTLGSLAVMIVLGLARRASPIGPPYSSLRIKSWTGDKTPAADLGRHFWPTWPWPPGRTAVHAGAARGCRKPAADRQRDPV
jgi:hypothetical protein